MNSQDPIQIIARLDANDNIGMAHGVRVKKLLSMLKTSINLHVCGEGDELSYLFHEDGQIIKLPSYLNEVEKTEFLLDKAKEIGAKYILCDQPDMGNVSYNMLKQGGVKTIIIDDYGGAPFGDIIFNGTVLDSYHNYPNMENKANIYAGLDYALVSPNFTELNWQDNANNTLLVVVGGGERANRWALWLLSDEGPLNALEGMETTMVVGASFVDDKKLRSLAHDRNAIILQAVNQEHLAQLLSQHTVALTTGGMIVYEALSVGVPTIIYPQEDNLIPEALWFGENELLINLGQEGAQSKDELLECLTNIFDDGDLRKKLSNNASQHIDAQGMKRVATLIDDFIQEQGMGK